MLRILITIAVAVFSFLIALLLVLLLLPGFNQLASTDMDMKFIIKPVTWFIFIVSVLLLGVIAGLYPALLAISVSFLTVLWHSLHTARANPVESLRYE